MMPAKKAGPARFGLSYQFLRQALARYCEKVPADSPDAVLPRWKIADGTRRIVCGNLRAERVSAQRLVELEKDR